MDQDSLDPQKGLERALSTLETKHHPADMPKLEAAVKDHVAALAPESCAMRTTDTGIELFLLFGDSKLARIEVDRAGAIEVESRDLDGVVISLAQAAQDWDWTFKFPDQTAINLAGKGGEQIECFARQVAARAGHRFSPPVGQQR